LRATSSEKGRTGKKREKELHTKTRAEEGTRKKERCLEKKKIALLHSGKTTLMKLRLVKAGKREKNKISFGGNFQATGSRK